jgi:modulator of FtsH protease
MTPEIRSLEPKTGSPAIRRRAAKTMKRPVADKVSGRFFVLEIRIPKRHERQGTMMEGWHDFAVAQAGASAALAGLIFVGISINLQELMRFPAVLLRAASALALLLSVLVISSLVLVPDQSTRTLGFELLGVGIASWSFVTTASIRSLRKIERQYQANALLTTLFRQVATVPVPIGAILLIAGHDAGMYWVLVAIIAVFVVTITEAWVILVEIMR